MNGKRVVAVLLTGLLVVALFYGVSRAESISTVPVGDPEIGSDGFSTAALGRSGDGATAEDGPPAGKRFEDYPHYIAANVARYTAYQNNAPELDAETVLWHVNAGLDLAPYSGDLPVGGAHPLLVNKTHPLPADFVPAELVVIHGSVMATPGTAEAFRRMRAAAMKDGVYIEAAVGYRSAEKQRELFETEELYSGTAAAEALVARPGYGEHSTGRALHIVDRDYTFDGFESMPEYAWLTEHCAQYGFILRYGEGESAVTGFAHEPYHFTFVGAEIALGMAQSEIATLEEYAARGLAPDSDAVIDDRTAVVIATGYGGAGSTYETDIAQRIMGHLEEEDVRVVITQDSAEIEKETGADLLIGLEKAGTTGSSVAWFASDRPRSRNLAETVGSRLSWARCATVSRGINDDEKSAFAQLTEAPAVFLELADSAADPEKTAKAIADGIVAQLGLRKVFLTFDDGPSNKNTPKVLDILKVKGVKATFFVVGEMAEENPALLRRIADEGHTIGIHCYSHDYNELYASVESFTDDFDKARATVKEITGQEPVIYRFPGGSINNYNKEVYEEIIAEMDEKGYVYFDWNISTDDALGKVEVGELLKNTKSYPRSHYAVLLMHDAYANIVAELGDIIDYFSDYQMAVIEDDTEPVHF